MRPGEVVQVTEVEENRHYVVSLGRQTVDLEYKRATDGLPCARPTTPSPANTPLRRCTRSCWNTTIPWCKTSARCKPASKRWRSSERNRRWKSKVTWLASCSWPWAGHSTGRSCSTSQRSIGFTKDASETQAIHSWEFEQLGFWTGYGKLDIWPAFPATEHEFWLYIAHAAQQAGHKIPDFMLPVTDFSVLEKQFASWQRNKEIERWTHTLSTYHTDRSQGRKDGEPAGELDLRIVVGSTHLSFSWKRPGQEQFEPLRKTHFRTLMYDRPDYRFSVEAEVLW